jgi:phosphoenolpyruvate-protein kinase (PTS system EI component)
VRTLDIGIEGDSVVPVQTGEESAVLGLRGIRFSLKHPEIFRNQVREILRAREFGNLKIILPMVSSVDEVLEARKLIEGVEAELESENGKRLSVPVGVLIEVPATILILESIAKHVDFLAVGTNDLIQYTLAAGRLNDEIADLYNPLHPAILRSLSRISQVAEEHGTVTFVCGEMATNPVCATILVGMGFCHLSMTPFAIPRIKGTLRKVSKDELSNQIEELLKIETLTEIEYFVERQLGVNGENKREGV